MEEKINKQEEYKLASEYVESVYLAKAPPYTDEELDGHFARVQQLAPHVSLDRSWLERMIEKLQRRKPECHVPARSKEEWEKIFPRYPITSDGFAKSFAPEETTAIRETFSKFGLVVVHVFSQETCKKTIDAMFEEINSIDSPTRKVDVNPEVHDTWENSNWPSPKKFLIPRPAFHTQAFANRVDENIYAVFSALWQEHRLRISTDNWGATRGSTNLLLRTDEEDKQELVDKPSWGKGISPHWDYNPWLLVREVEQNRNPGYQGVVALNDHVHGMGCHRTLPGGLPFLHQWTLEHGCPEGLGVTKRKSCRPKEDDPILQYMQEIPLRQGDLLVWSWGQLHATAHNDSDTMRLHQYIRMFPAPEVDPFYEQHDRYATTRIARQYADILDLEKVADQLKLDSTGRRLLGLETW